MDLTTKEAAELLQARLSTLESRIAEDSCEAKRLRAVLKLLNEEAPAAEASSEPGCVKKELVVRIAEQLLRECGPLDAAELDQMIRKAVREQGYSLSGYARCHTSAFQSEQFVTDGQGRIGLRPAKPDLSVA